MPDSPCLELYWIPLGAGKRVVRISGSAYEGLSALAHRRPRCPLYHSALMATNEAGRTVVEMAPVPDGRGIEERGVVVEGPVGMRSLGRLRLFRYEVRRWPGGVIPDLSYAESSPVRITDDPVSIRRVLELVADVPALVWGRDEVGAGEMWNSNSVVSWILTHAGLESVCGPAPSNGRAPGWDAGVRVAAATVPRSDQRG